MSTQQTEQTPKEALDALMASYRPVIVAGRITGYIRALQDATKILAANGIGFDHPAHQQIHLLLGGAWDAAERE